MNRRFTKLSDGLEIRRAAIIAQASCRNFHAQKDAVDVKIRPLSEENLLQLAPHLREMDRLEVASLMPDQSITDALLFSGRASARSRAGFWKGQLVACWGIVPESPGSTKGTPWLLATDAIDNPDVRRAFIRYGADEMRRLTGGFRYLWNLVHRENDTSRRWLRFMGFEFRDPQEYVFSDEPFVRFEMELS